MRSFFRDYVSQAFSSSVMKHIHESFKGVKKNDFLEAIKREYGLVPAENEPMEDFEVRAYETVWNKDDPEKNWIIKLLSKGKVKGKDITKEVQSTTELYLGIKNEPIEAWKKSKLDIEGVGGYTVRDEDGSSLVFLSDKSDNTQEIISDLAEGLENIVQGKSEDYDIYSSKASIIFYEAGFDNNQDFHKVYCKMFEKVLENETFVKLHEGIHANHINNSSLGRRRKRRNGSSLLKHVVLTKIPILGSFFRAFYFNFTAETEALAYKVGMDCYITDMLDKAASRVELSTNNAIPIDMLKEIKRDFMHYNSNLSKSIITEGYLKSKAQGFGYPKINYGRALLMGMYGSMLLGCGSFIPESLGAIMLIGSLNRLVKIPFVPYFKTKINKSVDTISKLTDQYGGAGKAFYETLGMSFAKMEKLAYRNENKN